MALDQTQSIRRFLESQVLRSDYLIVDEPSRFYTRLPYELKLERMHCLCIANGHCEARQGERIRRTLYSAEDHSDRPISLLLIESYLPHCVVKLPLQPTPTQSDCDRFLDRLAQSISDRPSACRQSQLDWNDVRYLMCLPPDVHALLIDHDGALMAA